MNMYTEFLMKNFWLCWEKTMTYRNKGNINTTHLNSLWMSSKQTWNIKTHEIHVTSVVNAETQMNTKQGGIRQTSTWEWKSCNKRWWFTAGLKCWYRRATHSHKEATKHFNSEANSSSQKWSWLSWGRVFKVCSRAVQSREVPQSHSFT